MSSNAKSRQAFLPAMTEPNILFGWNWRHTLGALWHDCLLATPSLSNEPNLLSTLSSYETSHLSLSDSFSQMGTAPPYSPSGEITGRNRWDEALSSAEIWTYSPQQTEKEMMTLSWCAEILVRPKCVIVWCQTSHTVIWKNKRLLTDR